MTEPQPVYYASPIMLETREAMKKALEEHYAEIERRLTELGLSFADIPNRLQRIDKIGYPATSVYLFDDNPILETRLILDGNTIRFEIRPL